MKPMKINRIVFFLSLFAIGLFLGSEPAQAKTGAELEVQTDGALDTFRTKVYGAGDIMSRAKGVLVMRIFRAGIGLGFEYGEGALRVGGKTVDYYNTLGGSLGFQLGGQVRTVYLFFMEEGALKNFQSASGWKAGIDVSVVLISIGADGSVDTMKSNEPIFDDTLNQKGLMYNLTLDISKFNKTVK